MARTVGLGAKTNKKDNGSVKLKEQLCKAEKDIAAAKKREDELLKQNDMLTKELEELKKDKKDA